MCWAPSRCRPGRASPSSSAGTTRSSRSDCWTARSRLRRARGAEVDVILSPGAFELGILSLEAARSGRYAGVAALGCVIRGDTTHYDYVCSESARGILRAGLETGVPVAFGVVTCETAEQAFARAGGTAGNKGFEAVETALDTAAALDAVRAPR